jgi:3-methyladenine DNA glycosylase AlkD
VMWRRRAAIVSQVRRKERTDVALLYDCIEPSRGEREFFLRKGIGWALRAYAWVDPDEIERYCATHELSALSRREALRNVTRIRGAS